MNKIFPLALNSILFIAGIGFSLAGQPTLCMVCFLLLSLLFIWMFRLEAIPGLPPADEAFPDDADTLCAGLSLQVQELTDTNQLLSEENRCLTEQLNLCQKEYAHTSQVLYTCPLTSTLPVNLNTFFTAYLENHADLIEYRKLHSDYSCSVPEADTFMSSAALTLICDNVLDNMLKFTPKSETVYVRMTALENDTLVIFRNGGDGPDSCETDKIFALNYQGANRKYGCGLGLAQVKAVIEDFGGRVWAKSARDTGFTLYIRLPRQTSES